MITRRDIVVALIAASGDVRRGRRLSSQAAILKSRVFDWTAMTAKDNAYGSVRVVVRAPTATLDELEMHVTTLNPGQTSHAPHQHAERGADHPARGHGRDAVARRVEAHRSRLDHLQRVERPARREERRHGAGGVSRRELEVDDDAGE